LPAPAFFCGSSLSPETYVTYTPRRCFFDSFLRQINHYGFKKMEQESWTWAHPSQNFRRNMPGMLHKIQRNKGVARPSTSLLHPLDLSPARPARALISTAAPGDLICDVPRLGGRKGAAATSMDGQLSSPLGAGGGSMTSSAGGISDEETSASIAMLQRQVRCPNHARPNRHRLPDLLLNQPVGEI